MTRQVIRLANALAVASAAALSGFADLSVVLLNKLDDLWGVL